MTSAAASQATSEEPADSGNGPFLRKLAAELRAENGLLERQIASLQHSRDLAAQQAAGSKEGLFACLHLEERLNSQGRSLYGSPTAAFAAAFSQRATLFCNSLKAALQKADSASCAQDNASSGELMSEICSVLRAQKRVAAFWKRQMWPHVRAFQQEICAHNTVFPVQHVWQAHVTMVDAAALTAQQAQSMAQMATKFLSDFERLQMQQQHVLRELQEIAQRPPSPHETWLVRASHRSGLMARARRLADAEMDLVAGFGVNLLVSPVLSLEQTARLQAAHVDVLPEPVVLATLLVQRGALASSAPPASTTTAGTPQIIGQA